MTYKETIICSAVQFNGLNIAGRRHKDCYAIIQAFVPTFKNEDIDRSKQGFITSTGRYVNRKEAWVIADDAGQILYGYDASNNGENSELISENLFADIEDMPIEVLLQTEDYEEVKKFIKKNSVKFVRWINSNAGHELGKMKDGRFVEIFFTYRDNNVLNRIYNIATTHLTK
jgi:hypothetical protein